jgi:hypothetical protein
MQDSVNKVAIVMPWLAAQTLESVFGSLVAAGQPVKDPVDAFVVAQANLQRVHMRACESSQNSVQASAQHPAVADGKTRAFAADEEFSVRPLLHIPSTSPPSRPLLRVP